MQLRDHARVCPCCGKDPRVEDPLDDAAWFGAGQASENSPDDHILEAMMAIAAAKPKAVHGAAAASLPPGPPPEAQEPAVPLQALAAPSHQLAAAPADQSTPPAPLVRRVLFGAVAVSAFAALAAAVLLNTTGVFLGQRTEPAAVARPALAPVRERIQSEAEPAPASTASAEAPVPVVPAAPPDRPEEDPQSIANALGLADRAPRTPAPVATRRTAPPAAAAPAAPGGTESSERCSEALSALALCRRP